MREPGREHPETSADRPTAEAVVQGEKLPPEPVLDESTMAEPMDDLLAELLAQDIDLAAGPGSPEMPPTRRPLFFAGAEEPDLTDDLEALTEPAALEAVAADVAGALEPQPPLGHAVGSGVQAFERCNESAVVEPGDDSLAELAAQDLDLAAAWESPQRQATARPPLFAGAEALDPAAELAAVAELAALETDVAAPLLKSPVTQQAPLSEAGVFELQAEEPDPLLASGVSRELLPEPAEAELSTPLEEAKQEIAVRALGPQPPLDRVLSGIDAALEQTRALVVPVESAPQLHHHKQFSQLDDYVVFLLSGSDYAVPVRDVAEIGRVPAITRVPNVPDFIRGITNLRGEVVPVLNLPNLLGLEDVPLSARGRVLFLQGRNRIPATGLVVEEVKGIQRIQSQRLEQVTGLVDDKVTLVLRGVHGRGDRLLNVLDLEQLFQLQEFRQLEMS